MARYLVAFLMSLAVSGCAAAPKKEGWESIRIYKLRLDPTVVDTFRVWTDSCTNYTVEDASFLIGQVCGKLVYDVLSNGSVIFKGYEPGLIPKGAKKLEKRK